MLRQKVFAHKPNVPQLFVLCQFGSAFVQTRPLRDFPYHAAKQRGPIPMRGLNDQTFGKQHRRSL